MAAILSLLLILLLSILIIRVAAIALTHTGLSRELARFQSLSAFSGVGYTTQEAERVVNHPLRRRILIILMILGNVGIITAASSLIVTFMDPKDGGGSPFVKFGIIIAGLLLLWILAGSRWANRMLSKLVRYFLRRYTRLDIQDYDALLQLAGEYQVSELVVEPDDWLEGKTITDAALRDEGILVLAIKRPDGTYRGIPVADTMIQADDTLIIYGRVTAVAAIDERKHGKLGDIEHYDSVLEEKRIEEEERKADPLEGQKDEKLTEESSPETA